MVIDFIRCIVPHQYPVRVRWRLILLLHIIVLLPTALVRREEVYLGLLETRVVTFAH